MNKKSLVELLVLTFFLFTFLNSHTQVRTHTLSKISPSKIKIDGIITEEEIEESKIFNPNHIIIIHRESKANDNFQNMINILKIKSYGRSKIIFATFN